MRIAVTGGTGFLGRVLVDRLSSAGHDCVLLSRHPETLRGLPRGATAVRWAAGEPLPPERIEGAEAVLNLAGESVAVRWSEDTKRRIRDSRVNGTRHLATAARAVGTVRHFVSASAIGYYGNDRGAELLDESSAPGADFLAQVCREWESAAMTAGEGSGSTRVALVRIGVVLHPEGGAMKQMLTPLKLGVGGRIGSGEQYLSWIHREDLVRLFEHVFAHPELTGPTNATAPEPVTNAELTRAMARHLHRPAVLPVPGFALKALFGEMAENILGGQRVLPKRAIASGFEFKFPTVDAALRDLLA